MTQQPRTPTTPHHGFNHDSELPPELCTDADCEEHQPTVEMMPVEAITGAFLHRAWLKSGRPDPLLDDRAWDGFGLTLQALARVERLTRASAAPVEST